VSGICRSCLAGRRPLCTQAVGVGVHRDGCFAEYLCLPASNAWHVDPSISSEIAAIFDPFGNATHATLSFDLVGDDTLLYAACFDTNGGVFEPLLGPDAVVITDALNHASIIDGIRLTKAKRYLYQHSDMDDLKATLIEARGAPHRSHYALRCKARPGYGSRALGGRHLRDRVQLPRGPERTGSHSGSDLGSIHESTSR